MFGSQAVIEMLAGSKWPTEAYPEYPLLTACIVALGTPSRSAARGLVLCPHSLETPLRYRLPDS